MKVILKNFCPSDFNSIETIFMKAALIALTMLLTLSGLHAQTVSGNWDGANITGATGYTNHNNGVIQLLSTAVAGCQGAAVHETSVKYDPGTGAVFNQCYQVFFGCPGDDEIGSDTKGDGMAFSFSACGFGVGSCGGGLGYNGGCGEMITIEFDTYSSMNTGNFDGSYGGGITGNNDEVAIHKNGDASNNGRITSADAGNLEDGLEHQICISYDPATDVYSVTIDGVAVLNYDATGTGNELEVYFFGDGPLNQTWSSGKDGATNPSTVSHGTDITDQTGPLCPAAIVITSPSGGTSVGTCDGPITITAAATPPAGNTVDFVEFMVDGVSIGTDNTDPYSVSWNSLTVGDHAIEAVAHYTPSLSSSASSATNITIGGGIELTSAAPVIDGTIDVIWGNYAPVTLGNELPVPGATAIGGPADLSATFRTMRDATNLYILVDVTDDDLQGGAGNNWDNDGVEFFIDMGNDKSGTYGANDYQYAFVNTNPTPIEYYHSPGSLTGVTFSQGAKAGGYIMEISIPWSSLGGAPIDGELIGIDVHVNEDDADGDSERDAKIAWSDETDQAFNNPSVFGTVSASACNPCPTGVLSGDNTICNDGTTTSNLRVDFTGAGPYTFTYSIDGVTQPAVSSINDIFYEFASATGEHTYALVSVSNATASGCTANATGMATISVSDFPVGHDGKFTPPGTASLSVDNTGGTYEWYDAPTGGNLVFTGLVFITPVLSDTTVYYVQEIPGASCRTEVRAIPEGNFFIPNLITPNSDGKNDLFEISALPAGSALKVFNRWGDSVYQSSNYDNLWTCGNMVDGVYYFDLKLPDGKQFKGWLNIVR